MKIGTGANRRIVAEKKSNADRSGIGIKITGTARSLSNAGSKTLNCTLLEIALSAMVMIRMIDLIDSITTMIDDLMCRLGGEIQFMIGWGAGSAYMIGLVIVSDIFLEIKRSLKKWQMHEFPMSSYFAGMLILIKWSQGKIATHRCGSLNLLCGVQRG